MGCGDNEGLPKPRPNDLVKVVYDTLYDGKLDTLKNVTFEEVTKWFRNGDTAAHYYQMEIILPWFTIYRLGFIMYFNSRYRILMADAVYDCKLCKIL